MNYEEALVYLDGGQFGRKEGLAHMRELLRRMGDPQNSLRFVHVAGTNGKGSTTTMIAESLQKAGLRTGRYISPYVIEFRERICVDGEMIPKEAVIDCTQYVKPLADAMADEGMGPTRFEIVTAIAFEWFRRCGCEIVSLEVGLGGRLDATNVIDCPEVAVLCAIGYDHVKTLGSTLGQIAWEKAGILKAGGTAVCYPQMEPEALAVVRRVAAERGCPLVIGDMGRAKIRSQCLAGTELDYDGLRLHVPLLGEHQVMNAINAVQALRVLQRRGWPISDEHIVAGVAATRFPARMEVFCRSPLVILDGAHNSSGAQALAKTLKEFCKGKVLAMLGMLGNKDVGLLEYIVPLCSTVVAVAPSYVRRARDAQSLAAYIRPLCADVWVEYDHRKALNALLDRAGPEDVVLICGSLYLASDIRPLLLEKFG